MTQALTVDDLAGKEWITLSRWPLYLIGLHGQVVSLVKKTPRLMKPGMRGKYRGFTLLNASRELESVYLHRMIAEAAHGEPKDGQVCRHLDGDRFNCRADNLAWGSYADNLQDAREHGTIAVGERSGRSSLTETEVRAMREMREATGLAYRQIAKRFSVTTMTAYRAITGQNWSHVK